MVAACGAGFAEIDALRAVVPARGSAHREKSARVLRRCRIACEFVEFCLVCCKICGTLVMLRIDLS